MSKKHFLSRAKGETEGKLVSDEPDQKGRFADVEREKGIGRGCGIENKAVTERSTSGKKAENGQRTPEGAGGDSISKSPKQDAPNLANFYLETEFFLDPITLNQLQEGFCYHERCRILIDEDVLEGAELLLFFKHSRNESFINSLESYTGGPADPASPVTGSILKIDGRSPESSSGVSASSVGARVEGSSGSPSAEESSNDCGETPKRSPAKESRKRSNDKKSISSPKQLRKTRARSDKTEVHEEFMACLDYIPQCKICGDPVYKNKYNNHLDNHREKIQNGSESPGVVGRLKETVARNGNLCGCLLCSFPDDGDAVDVLVLQKHYSEVHKIAWRKDFEPEDIEDVNLEACRIMFGKAEAEGVMARVCFSAVQGFFRRNRHRDGSNE